MLEDLTSYFSVSGTAAKPAREVSEISDSPSRVPRNGRLTRPVLRSVLFCVVAVAVLALIARWPFRRAATIECLERISSAEVHIAGFRETFFPQPGYIAENVTFTRGDTTHPLATVRTIRCRASWLALATFTHTIDRMDLEGLTIEIPRHVPPPVPKHPQMEINTTVTELAANGAVLDVAPRTGGTKTLRFEFQKLLLNNVAAKKSIQVQADLRNPDPPSEIKVRGAVGPLTRGQIAQTRISGTFEVSHTDLSVYKAIRGNLETKGIFDGVLGHAKLEGHADIPDFEVVRSKHSFGLTTEYHAVVNGTNGDVTLQLATATFLNTTLAAKGTIEGELGKTLSLDLDSRSARTEDLLRVVASADPPSLQGPVTLQAHVVLPPAHQPFLQRLRLNGAFEITNAAFTSSQMQAKVDQLSARALGNKRKKQRAALPRVTEQMKSEVQIRGGVATLSSASFEVPGAIARGRGWYNFLDGAIGLKGNLAMDARLSKAVGGLKGILMKPLDPFFKKGEAGSVLPVRVTGTYKHPVFKVSLRR